MIKALREAGTAYQEAFLALFITREFWTQRADGIRADWDQYVDRWEADTEPGYPMTNWDESRREFALAVANLCDSIGGRTAA